MVVGSANVMFWHILRSSATNSVIVFGTEVDGQKHGRVSSLYVQYIRSSRFASPAPQYVYRSIFRVKLHHTGVHHISLNIPNLDTTGPGAIMSHECEPDYYDDFDDYGLGPVSEVEEVADEIDQWKLDVNRWFADLTRFYSQVKKATEAQILSEAYIDTCDKLDVEQMRLYEKGEELLPRWLAVTHHRAEDDDLLLEPGSLAMLRRNEEIYDDKGMWYEVLDIYEPIQTKRDELFMRQQEHPSDEAVDHKYRKRWLSLVMCGLLRSRGKWQVLDSALVIMYRAKTLTVHQITYYHQQRHCTSAISKRPIQFSYETITTIIDTTKSD